MSTHTHATSLQPRATYLYEKSNIINVSRKGRIISAASGSAALAIAGFVKQPFIKKVLKAAGYYLLYRGVSGNCPASAIAAKKTELLQHSPAVNIKTSFFVNQPKEIIYFLWRDFENLPDFMAHLKEVKFIDVKRSHWAIKTPAGVPSIEWDAEILEDNGDVLSWRSLPGSMIETAGKITFETWPGGKTQVDILISYRPPAGYIGTAIAMLLKTPFEKMVKNDVENFKRYIETVNFSEELA